MCIIKFIKFRNITRDANTIQCIRLNKPVFAPRTFMNKKIFAQFIYVMIFKLKGASSYDHRNNRIEIKTD